MRPDAKMYRGLRMDFVRVMRGGNCAYIRLQVLGRCILSGCR
jgi:hypothetical protein